ncbi:hypothetical protein GCM10009720_01920 [Yaniella flava]|uniref:Uncharacterized protein n=1 Tax=Yaniella flava TaxID=287930 RepID=A0ABP5FFX5_9MICC|nr:hypothetical protein [Micrococcaceae bacterium]
MSGETRTDIRTLWGRTRFASGRFPALALAIPLGLVLAVGAGAITLWAGVARGELALLIAAVFAVIMAPGLAGLVWALVVDRSTIKGAIDKPEESVESKWLNSAMSGALSDTVTVTGLGLATIAITGFDFDVLWALTGVLLIAIFSTFVRYVMAMKRG